MTNLFEIEGLKQSLSETATSKGLNNETFLLVFLEDFESG
jgi:hypothetical protein